MEPGPGDNPLGEETKVVPRGTKNHVKSFPAELLPRKRHLGGLGDKPGTQENVQGQGRMAWQLVSQRRGKNVVKINGAKVHRKQPQNHNKKSKPEIQQQGKGETNNKNKEKASAKEAP